MLQDRLRHVLQAVQPQDAIGVRQRRLVDDLDRVGVCHGPDRSRRRAINSHGRILPVSAGVWQRPRLFPSDPGPADGR
jgi:hypothetical protein